MCVQRFTGLSKLHPNLILMIDSDLRLHWFFLHLVMLVFSIFNGDCFGDCFAINYTSFYTNI